MNTETRLTLCFIGGLSYPVAIGLLLAGIPWGGLVLLTAVPCWVSIVTVDWLAQHR